jgi:hypothetical protein
VTDHSKQWGIHLTFPLLDSLALEILVSELHTQFALMEGVAQVMAFGRSSKQQWGFVELVWTGEQIDPAFLKDLTDDHEVLDLCVYPLPDLMCYPQ